jgi:3'-phosphoadenosine 5'-phosphosulfate sulfotransferase (PAPS reductase)/FAD synthetase
VVTTEQVPLFDFTLDELESFILTARKVSRSLVDELKQAVANLSYEDRLLRLKRLIIDSHALVDRAIEEQVTRAGKDLAGLVIMFSGGNDSTVLAHLFRERATHVGMANTGIGIEATREYVRHTAVSWGIPVIEKHPEPGYGYRELVLGQCRAKTGRNKGAVLWPGGFPGPAAHAMMYQRLKERAFEAIRRDLVRNPRVQRVVFLGGRRATESGRRATLAFRSPIERKGSTVWVAPLINWTPTDMNTYRRLYPDVPRNPVSDLIHMSGECLCGAFADENELEEIGIWFPDVAAEIRALETEVVASGVAPSKMCRWGWGFDKGRSGEGCDCRMA